MFSKSLKDMPGKMLFKKHFKKSFKKIYIHLKGVEKELIIFLKKMF